MKEKKKHFVDILILLSIILTIGILFAVFFDWFPNKKVYLVNQLTTLCQSYNFTPTFNNLKGFTFFTHRDIKGIYLYNYSNSTYTCLEKDTFCIEGIYLCFDGELHSGILNYTITK